METMWALTTMFFKVLVFDFLYMPKVYGTDELYGSRHFIDNLLYLVDKFHVRQIWLPHTPPVALQLANRITEFTDRDMVCIAVEDRWMHPLYAATKRSEHLFNFYDDSPATADGSLAAPRYHKGAPFLCLESIHIEWGINEDAEDTTGYVAKKEAGKTRSGKK